MRTPLFTITLIALGTLGSHAAVTATVTGGSGAPVTVTLSGSVQFVDVPVGMTSYGFVLLGAASGNSVPGANSHTGDIGWNGASFDSSNGGMGTTSFGGEFSINDLFVFWNNADASTSTMTLGAGTRTTTTNIDSVFVQGTNSYEIQMFNQSGTFVGTAVPEPSVISLLPLGLAVAFRRRRG